MPWSVHKDDRCPAGKPWAVVKDSDNSLEGCHMTEAEAQDQQAALYANEGRAAMPETESAMRSHMTAEPPEGHGMDSDQMDGMSMEAMQQRHNSMHESGAEHEHPMMKSATVPGSERADRPPRDNLVRSVMPGVELRAEDDAKPTLFGHFAVFDQWTEIDSAFEGHFMERLAPGAFLKSISEKRDRIRVLFQHGQDPQIGNKPLGPIAELREDKIGAYYEVPLSDTSYNRDLTQLLRDGLLGASFRFSVMKEDFRKSASKSPYNPDGLPERTIQEVDLMEFGPVTFPAYASATAGVRSDTDDYIRHLLVPEFDEIREALKALQALPSVGAGATHSDEASRPLKFHSRQEYLQWLTSR